MAATAYDMHGWKLSQDEEGFRSYDAIWQVRTTDPLDGPMIVSNAAGLPAIGSIWAYGNDNDPWCFCTPEAKVEPVEDRERCCEWLVSLKFTNKPRKRCQDTNIDNPLNEPPDISGSFLKYTKEATQDRYGSLILNSAYEPIIGASVERDYNSPTVSIKLNQPAINLSNLALMIDAVNDAPLWGLGARCVKLENVSWARKLYGTCTFYFTISFEFKINYNTFDRKLIDKGSRVLMSGGTVGNQEHYEKKKEASGEPVEVLLNGAGNLLAAGASPVILTKQLYIPMNLLTLGIPSSLV